MDARRPVDPITNTPISPPTIFKPLQVRDDVLRSAGLLAVLERVRKYEAGSVSQGEAAAAHRAALIYLMPSMFRLSYECPFEDIRNAFTSYLDHLRGVLGLVVVNMQPHTHTHAHTTAPLVSSFVSAQQLRPLHGDESVRDTFMSAFATYGRVSNLSKVLAGHPPYLELLLSTFRVCVNEEDGPLPLTWRTYIAVMACARHDCVYMMRRQQDMFMTSGGDVEWLEGLAGTCVPLKLRALAQLNALLAHRPWLLRTAHIRALTSDGAAPWSINELVHAIVVMTFFHSLCSLCQGVGVCMEPDSGTMLGVPFSRVVDVHTLDVPDDSTVVTEDPGQVDGAAPVLPSKAYGRGTRAADGVVGPSYNAKDVAAREAELQARLLAMQGSAAFDITTLPLLVDPSQLEASVATVGLSEPAVLASASATPPAALAAAVSGDDDDEDVGGGWNLAGGVDSPAFSRDGGRGKPGREHAPGPADSDDVTRADVEDDDDGANSREDDGVDDAAFEEAGEGAFMLGGWPATSVDADGPSDSAGAELPPPAVFRGAGPITDLTVPTEEETKRRRKKREGDMRRRAKHAQKHSDVSGAAAAAAADVEVEDPRTLDIATLRYRDFETSDGMFVTHDFGWEDHAYALLQRFYPAAAPVLDEQFRLTFELTYHTFGAAAREIDTEPFRTAVWYYVQRLYGVCNDHYDYQLVNRLLTREVKGFAKKVACFPETMTREEFNTFSAALTADERIHIVMLAAEARRQAALLYALRVVSKHMSEG